jgi:insertion element IS1 protein InsB
MTEIICKRCQATEYVKNGMVRGLHAIVAASVPAISPRPSRTANRQRKALALLLYAMGNMSFCSIGRLLKVSDVSVLRWARVAALALPERRWLPMSTSSISTRCIILSNKDKQDMALASVWSCPAANSARASGSAWWCNPGLRRGRLCQQLLDKVGIKGHSFLTDDREGFHRLIPEDQRFTGKDLTFPIEQDNSNIRHYLARLRRRTKVVSKCPKMVDLALRLHHHLREPKNYAALAAAFLSIFT